MNSYIHAYDACVPLTTPGHITRWPIVDVGQRLPVFFFFLFLFLSSFLRLPPLPSLPYSILPRSLASPKALYYWANAIVMVPVWKCIISQIHNKEQQRPSRHHFSFSLLSMLAAGCCRTWPGECVFTYVVRTLALWLRQWSSIRSCTNISKDFVRV